MVSRGLWLCWEWHLLNVNMNTVLNKTTTLERLELGCVWGKVRIVKENLLFIFYDGKFIDNA